MNTQQEYEYFDGDGQISQGNEDQIHPVHIQWCRSGFKKGEALAKGVKYRRSINVFSKEYQAELAKQWVLEGGFERETSDGENSKWFPVLGTDKWYKHIFYRRKQTQPTREELDAQAAKEYSKTATIHTDATVIEKAYMEGMKHERNRIK